MASSGERAIAYQPQSASAATNSTVSHGLVAETAIVRSIQPARGAAPGSFI